MCKDNGLIQKISLGVEPSLSYTMQVRLQLLTPSYSSGLLRLLGVRYLRIFSSSKVYAHKVWILDGN